MLCRLRQPAHQPRIADCFRRPRTADGDHGIHRVHRFLGGMIGKDRQPATGPDRPGIRSHDNSPIPPGTLLRCLREHLQRPGEVQNFELREDDESDRALLHGSIVTPAGPCQQ
jgi:hypothetical protein